MTVTGGGGEGGEEEEVSEEEEKGRYKRIARMRGRVEEIEEGGEDKDER